MALFKKKAAAEEGLPADNIAVADEEVDADKIMREYDRESNTRIWEGIPKVIVTVVLVLFSVYCILMTLLSTEQAEARLARFLAFVIVIGYLMYPVKKGDQKPNHMPWYDIVLAAAGLIPFMYFAVNATDILLMGARITQLQVVLGIIGLISLSELCRRCVGIPIMVVVACLMVYAFYFQFGHSGDAYRALSNVIQKLFYTTRGVIGTPTNVCYTFIVLFIIFGAFLERTGISNFFIAFANRIAGWSSGGPAKVAVISSALCGMVSGSSVGNTVTTGSVTIPMMKKTGYKPEFAGAVEAASSTGGQIMPPIMGAAAFLMAEYMGIPYIQVAAVAVIPAILYFSGIFFTVHLEAKKLGLKGIPMSQLPKWKYLGQNCYLILPLVVLVWLVSAGVFTMAMSAAISIVLAFAIGLVHFIQTNWQERTEEQTFGTVVGESLKTSLWSASDALAAGAKSSITVAVACAMAGLIAGSITVTGLASVLINVIVNAASGTLIIGLLLTMICCLVLGMGVPTTANYCIMAATCAPILIQLGVPLLCAHFFVFYFGILADITPPVALAAFAGSAIAKSRPMKTAVNATRLAVAAYIVPYVFAYFPSLLGQGVAAPMVVLNTAMAMVGLIGIAAALGGFFYGHMTPVFRVAIGVAGFLVMIPLTTFGDTTLLLANVIGLVVMVLIGVFERARNKGNKNTPAAPVAA
jgi:TRAP transporter 4TM/12TM fusion protein